MRICIFFFIISGTPAAASDAFSSERTFLEVLTICDISELHTVFFNGVPHVAVKFFTSVLFGEARKFVASGTACSRFSDACPAMH